ncbi:hypothetical protein DOQ08_02167 [Marinobacter litoralis]|uniref:Uncharacterized protein n=1 Tax=Marinobacter litoralis TaxID=187981 RepID=A0A3M2RBN2_9GAMM|nr:hypothetical protein DOQ08_02167 [Marinobacter litoralis]
MLPVWVLTGRDAKVGNNVSNLPHCRTGKLQVSSLHP